MGASATFTIVAQVALTVPDQTLLQTTTNATTTTTDPTPQAGNDVATVSTRVRVLDFGDVPDSYRTLLANNGARHASGSGLFLGSQVTVDADGRLDELAAADLGDDGVAFTTHLRQGQTASVRVNASRAGRLDAFLDFNGDGDFAEADEKIFDLPEMTGRRRWTCWA